MSLPGSVLAISAFNVTFVGMLLLALPRPRFYVYTFLSLFLFLGFCAKYWVHGALGFEFIEPIGAFDGSAAAWDRALWLASAGAFGMILGRVVQLAYHRHHRCLEMVAKPWSAPHWFLRHRRAVWIGFVLLVASVDGWNVWAAFYQIGVNPRVVLPLSMNAPLAWLVNVAFALGVAVLVQWELSLRATPGAFVAPIVEAVLCSASSLSRSAYVLHAGPYVFAWLERRRELTAVLAPWSRRLLGALVIGALLALGSVQWLRTTVYFAPSAASPSAASGAAETAGFNYLPQMMKQLPLLLVHRWVGLEGVLAASSHPESSPALFRAALAENPKAGLNSIYQRIAHSTYKQSEQFTFLTLPGVIGVLSYSASMVIVMCGAALVAVLLAVMEWSAARCTGNPFVLAVAGAAMANVASNLNFPYLAAVFMAELLVTLVAIRLLHSSGPAA